MDEIGKAAGVTYEDTEPLNFDKKAAAYDEARWELNPASSEDFQERQNDLSPKTSSRTKPNSGEGIST